MDRFVLSANLVAAIQNYLNSRPFAEVANIALALNQQVQAQLPKEESQEPQTAQE